MRLAIVGLDGVGKTTLSSYLSKELGIPVFKDNAYKQKYFGNSEYVYHSNSLLFDFISQTNQSIILDRCFWDEYVYGKAFNRVIDRKRLVELDYQMAKLGFSLVLLVRNNYNMKDDIIPESKQKELEDNYYEVLQMTGCKTTIVNVEFENPKQSLLEIITNHYQ